MKNTVDLQHTPFSKIKRIALEQAQDAHLVKYGRRLTLDMLHVKTAIPLSTISRYFNEADNYNPSPETLPVICNAMENWLMIDWQAEQCRGMFIRRGANDRRDSSVMNCADRIQRASAEMISAMLDATRDGVINKAELDLIAANFRRVAQAAEEGCDVTK